MPDPATTNNTTVREAEAAIEALECDKVAILNTRRDLTIQIPFLRLDRTKAARAALLSGGPRKVWQAALQAEQEGSAMLADIDAVVALLNRELTGARLSAESAKREARTAALHQRLRRVASENDFAVPETAEFLHDVQTAYAWLSTVGRTDTVDRKHSHTFWLDRVSAASRHTVPTQAFVAAAMCHGDIAIEMGDHVVSFGIIEGGNKPARSLPLSGDPTPSANRALITTVKPARPGYR
jgi:hypothetical protein